MVEVKELTSPGISTGISIWIERLSLFSPHQVRWKSCYFPTDQSVKSSDMSFALCGEAAKERLASSLAALLD
jgi:hypothetical protein